MGHSFTFCKTCETPLDCDFCDKLAELMEPGHMTLEELKAEAKRQGYKLIKATRPRFERCLCGHNVHQWCSRRGMEQMVYCKHCGLESPWVRGGDDKVRNDFGEKEGANQWMRSNALSWATTRRRSG